MELSDLTSYAYEKYRMQEQHKWADFPGFSVLCHPQTGKWVALLMRQWDGETGTEIQRCDLKCGSDSLYRFHRPYLSPPIRMRGQKWINISFDDRTEKEIVYLLLDRAIVTGKAYGYTVVLGAQQTTDHAGYHETAIPFSASKYQPVKEQLPEKLREMRRLFEYGRETVEARAKNFYRQAVFMQDYEDDCPWTGGGFVRYFPTYHDLNTQQLRGYFTWRTRLRKGDYQPIPSSVAYLYIYELLNGVGADTPEDALQKLQAFERGYLDTGLGDSRMRQNLRRWMLEFAVLNGLPPEQAEQSADPKLVERDRALSALRSPEEHSVEAVFSALCALGGKKTARSPVLAGDPERGKALFVQCWKTACDYRWQGKDLFTLCFGERQTRRWDPLSNAVVYSPSHFEDRDYTLNDCRSYHCRNGLWQVDAYENLSFDRSRLQGFLHEADARLRRYLKTGRYLRENPADEWSIPYIDAVISADRKALLEAARPKINIDLSGLEQIRRDAEETRESLLIEETAEESEAFAETAPPETEEWNCDISLDSVQSQILCSLLDGRDASKIIKENHLMPSIVADAINEAFLDEIGDTVILCEDDKLLLVDDYIEDLRQLLGGTGNG